MTWKINGAVERGRTLFYGNGLAEGAGQNGALNHNGHFRRFPHLYLGIWLGGITAMAALAAFLTLMILIAPPCSGKSTIDGRDLCGDHTTARDVPGLTR